jgi:hypothetical protein
MHVLGFWHEVARPDRDQYISVNYENIQPGLEYNFAPRTEKVTSLNSPYDYYSVLHYDGDAFSKNGRPTITPLQKGVRLLNSPLRRLSPTDVAEIRTLYKCY